MVVKYNSKRCFLCGVKFSPTSGRQKYCTSCAREKERSYQHAYQEKYYVKYGKGKKDRWKSIYREHRKRLRSKVFDVLGDVCVDHAKNYGHVLTDRRVLHIDHIFGGGNKERSNMKQETLYRYIIKNKETAKQKYQILCANCNWIKRHAENP